MVPPRLPGRHRGGRRRRGCCGKQDQDADERHPGSRSQRLAEREHHGARQRSADRCDPGRSRNAGFENTNFHQASGTAQGDEQHGASRNVQRDPGLHLDHGKRPAARNRHAARRTVHRCRHGHGRHLGADSDAGPHGFHCGDARRQAARRFRSDLRRDGESAPLRIHARRIRTRPK